MSEIQNAIHNSIKSGEIVTITLDSESDMQKAFEEFLDTIPSGDQHDFVDRTATFREIWGWNDETPEGKMNWRVHLMQNERAGSARFAE